ncbi:hypothetical protein, partial [Archangium sp.]|uniref:hypothetical protein n=1 Tax=Archangium sp. TaxID=1872627 RepID=UPI002ED8878B
MSPQLLMGGQQMHGVRKLCLVLVAGALASACATYVFHTRMKGEPMRRMRGWAGALRGTSLALVLALAPGC